MGDGKGVQSDVVPLKGRKNSRARALRKEAVLLGWGEDAAPPHE
jgi:hypothetical protein